jgi:hypothetical protein
MSLYQRLKYSSAQLKKLAKEREAIWPPPISFSLMGKYTQPKGASEKDDKKESAKFIKFEIPLDLANPATDKYERKVKIFDDGTPLEWCEFREAVDDLFEAYGCADSTDANTAKRHHFYIALFAGRAKVSYIHNYNHYNAWNQGRPVNERASDSDVLRLVINETAKSFFDSWDSAVREQQQYMRQNLFLGDMRPSTFIERLKRMNKFLKYFPRSDVFDEDDVEMEEEQLITIVHHASHGVMQLQIQRAGKSINDFKTLDALKVFFMQQHDCDRLEERILNANGNGGGGSNKKKKHNKKRKKDDENDADSDKKPAAM